jgi:hypothetical protein
LVTGGKDYCSDLDKNGCSQIGGAENYQEWVQERVGGEDLKTNRDKFIEEFCCECEHRNEAGNQRGRWEEDVFI